MNGRDVFVGHQGENLHGEYLSISSFDPKFSTTRFKSITSVQKSETKNYVKLFWFKPETRESGLLAEYKPFEVSPLYRRFILQGGNYSSCCYKVSVLGRVRVLERYHDNDIIPIENIRALKLMAQNIQSTDNDNVQVAEYKDQKLDQTIKNEVGYKRTPSQILDWAMVNSGRSIKNMN